MVHSGDRDRRQRKRKEVMADNIKQQLTTLAALQHAEIAINRIEAELAKVQAHIDTIGLEATVFEEKIESHRLELGDIKAQYREDEGEVKVVEGRVSKNDEKLRAVKTNKEYQSLLKEIDELKKKKSGMEDRMLASLDRIEIAEREIAELEKTFEGVRSEVKEKQEEINKKAEGQRLQLEGYKEEREAVWAELPDRLKKLFEKVKVQGRGIAVAAIEDGTCQVCRINIPPQMFNELLRLDEIRLCPNCQRIVYPKVLIEKVEGE